MPQDGVLQLCWSSRESKVQLGSHGPPSPSVAVRGNSYAERQPEDQLDLSCVAVSSASTPTRFRPNVVKCSGHRPLAILRSPSIAVPWWTVGLATPW
jgi:hypothetical protein